MTEEEYNKNIEIEKSLSCKLDETKELWLKINPYEKMPKERALKFKRAGVPNLINLFLHSGSMIEYLVDFLLKLQESSLFDKMGVSNNTSGVWGTAEGKKALESVDALFNLYLGLYKEIEKLTMDNHE